MRRAQFYAIAAVSVLLLIFVVLRPQAKAPSGLRPLRLRGPVQTLIDACTTASNSIYGGPPRSNILHVVRLTIPPQFDVGSRVSPQIFEYGPASDEHDEAALDKNNSTGSPVDPLDTFPFNIDLSKDKPAAGKYTQIRLVLTDTTRFKFYTYPDSDPNPNMQGVVAGDNIGEPINKLGFCGAHYYSKDNLHTYPTVVFYMPLDAQKQLTGGYNFILQPIIYPTMQISIDPQVRNGGS